MLVVAVLCRPRFRDLRLKAGSHTVLTEEYLLLIIDRTDQPLLLGQNLLGKFQDLRAVQLIHVVEILIRKLVV